MDDESNNEGSHDEVRTVTIRLFGNHETAAQAVANLEAHGIKCWVSADDCGGMYPNLTVTGGVRLLVRATEAEAAIALLDTPMSAAEIASLDEVAACEPTKTQAEPTKVAYGQIIVGIIAGILICLLYQWSEKIGNQTIYHYGKTHRADEAWIYQNGHLIEHRMDRNHDGEWDYWSYHDGHGNILKTDEDNNYDGKPDEVWTYTNGDLISLEKDNDFNGIPDEFWIYKNHIIQQMDMKPNGAKYITLREIFKNGVLTEMWRDQDTNGNFKTVERYDPFFNLISTNAFYLTQP